MEGLRYVAAPPVSVDDLKTLAEASLAPSRLRASPDAVRRIIETILAGLDDRRFPWVRTGEEPTQPERRAAVLATAALMATSRVGTHRRHLSKTLQEERVEAALIGANWTKVATRRIATLGDAPELGEFCRESMLGSAKADFVVRLMDQRLMAIECKVSNSAVNSVKRLNRDAAAKAEAWRRDFGELQIVPTAILSGVYKLHNLEGAQRRGLTLFWAHDLGSLIAWVNAARP